jgi:predicted nucleotidyltransferase
VISDSWIALIVDWARQDSDIAEVWLYGSRARGDNRPDSDIDLAIVPIGNAEARLATFVCEGSQWKNELQNLFPVTVDMDFGDRDQCDAIVGPALACDGVRIYLND